MFTYWPLSKHTFDYVTRNVYKWHVDGLKSFLGHVVVCRQLFCRTTDCIPRISDYSSLFYLGKRTEGFRSPFSDLRRSWELGGETGPEGKSSTGHDRTTRHHLWSSYWGIVCQKGKPFISVCILLYTPVLKCTGSVRPLSINKEFIMDWVWLGRSLESNLKL